MNRESAVRLTAALRGAADLTPAAAAEVKVTRGS
jgi:hypothetical protein